MKVRPTTLYKLLLPQLIWEIRTTEKVLYLTFDDGPHPEITPEVLRILDQFDAKATFFCVGENVKKYPETYQMMLNKGHKTGNHSYNHLNGWKVSRRSYFENVEKCAKYVDSHLFRPPYGKINILHISYLKITYRIIMWSVLPRDYSKKISPEECLQHALKYSHPGSIIAFHDSEKAKENLLFTLPRYLEYFAKRGYRFDSISV
jgi:peptidoglycan/xylan/chitin deacetylase (PgdA/CDA1 family)